MSTPKKAPARAARGTPIGRPARGPAAPVILLLALGLAAGCGGGDGPPADGEPSQQHRQGGERRWGGASGGPPGAEETPAVPVEAVPVTRRAISSYIETNGTLEAENEVEIVARVSAPVVELKVEEGDVVARGQLMARLDESELEAQARMSEAAFNEARLAFERAERLRLEQLISPEAYEQALSRHDTARAQHTADRLQLGYAEVRAPFAGVVVARYVDPAQQVAPGTALFRLSDFEPLLCPIQVPERDLGKVRLGQPAYLTLETWPGERFAAEVLRIRPVVDAATGTVRVTLQVRREPRLTPGMFARVYLETATRDGALVMPKAALSLEGLGDTVYVVENGVARRREVELGFSEGADVEVVTGLAEGELVVVVGQDGLSDGTPARVLGGAAASGGAAPAPASRRPQKPAE